jgi:hypothetical protein
MVQFEEAPPPGSPEQLRAGTASAADSTGGALPDTDNVYGARASSAATETKKGDDATPAGGQVPPPPTVLVVLGRQYVPLLRALWEDRGSRLYRGSVPRTFAPST